MNFYNFTFMLYWKSLNGQGSGNNCHFSDRFLYTFCTNYVYLVDKAIKIKCFIVNLAEFVLFWLFLDYFLKNS